jgi:hypothetical protein
LNPVPNQTLVDMNSDTIRIGVKLYSVSHFEFLWFFCLGSPVASFLRPTRRVSQNLLFLC